MRDWVLHERAELAKRPESGGDASVRDRWSTTTCLMLIGVVFVVSRVVYATVLNVGFDASPLSYYVQYLDPRLLKEDLLRSLLNLLSQPPAFNLFLGLVLKAFPTRYDVVFHLVFLAAGLLMAWVLYLTMVSFGVRHAIAAGITIVAMCDPTTVLYEHWLFYTYPLMLLVLMAVWLLRRATTTGKFGDYFGFFSCLALAVLTRSTYHVALFVMMAAIVVTLQQERRLIAWAAAPAAAMLLAVHANAYARFGALSLGDSYAGINAPVLAFSYLPMATHEELVKAGKVNGATLVVRRSGVVSPLAAYRPYVPQLRDLRPTGIPALDEERKTQGWVNFNHQGFRLIADQVLTDSLYALREYPGAYLRYVVDNIRRYGLSRELAFPFTERRTLPLVNRRSNEELVSVCRTIGLSEFGVVPWLKCGAFALLTAYALWLAVVGLKSGDRSMGICMLFALGVIAPSYILILVSYGDQSRYRAEVDPVYLLILAIMLERAASRVTTLGRGDSARRGAALVATRIAGHLRRRS